MTDSFLGKLIELIQGTRRVREALQAESRKAANGAPPPSPRAAAVSETGAGKAAATSKVEDQTKKR